MRSSLFVMLCILAGAGLFGSSPAQAAPRSTAPLGTTQTTTILPKKLQAQDFGVKGDGVTDDGPAVLRMLDAAARAGGTVTLQFAPRRSYFLKTGRDGYALALDGAHDLVLDGGDSLFLIDSSQRFLKLTHSRNVTVRGFKVDYVPLPFADGTVVAKDKAKGTLDVHIDADQALPPSGGPTHEADEQAFFGALWAPGPYSTQGAGGAYWMRHNLDVRNVSAASPSRVVRVESNPGASVFDEVVVGKWRFSVPVRGIAHRYGAGETCRLVNNAGITLENLEIWSAPWFAFGITDNRVRVTLRRVNVRPKPDTQRNASSWRDAFHAKNNRASLRWEECTVQGSGDDAFNIATHTSTVFQVVTPTQIKLSQNYPLGVASMEVGDTLGFYDPVKGALLGRAKITKVDPANFAGDKAPLFTLDLDAPVAGLARGTTLAWNETSGNPHNVLYRCRMDTSCRFRSPVLLDTCQVNALAWFTGDEIESPLPSNSKIVDSQFRLGQGNTSQVIVMGGMYLEGHGPTHNVLANIIFNHNRVWGGVTLNDIKGLTITDNDFADAKRMVSLSNVADVIFRGNSHGGLPVEDTGDMMGHADF